MDTVIVIPLPIPSPIKSRSKAQSPSDDYGCSSQHCATPVCASPRSTSLLTALLRVLDDAFKSGRTRSDEVTPAEAQAWPV
eukprot:9501087-Pyramimonas_sp.AAC.1